MDKIPVKIRKNYASANNNLDLLKRILIAKIFYGILLLMKAKDSAVEEWLDMVLQITGLF
jgi:hypothetical protein